MTLLQADGADREQVGERRGEPPVAGRLVGEAREILEARRRRPLDPELLAVAGIDGVR